MKMIGWKARRPGSSSPADRIILVTDYGQSRFEFAAPEPEADSVTNTATYRVRSDSQDLTVFIEVRTCRDPMSGREFESTVTVTLDDRTLRGCGRALH